MHRYQFTVWALPKALEVKANTPPAMVGCMLNSLALGKATLTATHHPSRSPPDEHAPAATGITTSGSASSPLRRVLIYAPTSSVQQAASSCGGGSNACFDKESWLLILAGHGTTFVNQPEQGTFRSQALTLLAPPPARVAGREHPRSPQATGHQGDVGPRLLLRSRHHHGAAAALRDGPRPSCCKGFMASSGSGGLGLLFPATTMTLGSGWPVLPQRGAWS